MKRKAKPKMERRWVVLEESEWGWCVSSLEVFVSEEAAIEYAEHQARHSITPIHYTVRPVMVPKVTR